TTTPKSRARTTRSTNRARSNASTRTRATPAPQPSTASKLRAPLIAGGAAIAGIAGGIVLGAQARHRRRRRLPSVTGLDANKTRKQVASASKQFGAFTRELRRAGEQAERIGNALD